MKQISKYFIILYLLINSCNTTFTGYTFVTQAEYYAPVSLLKIEMTASGKVPSGQDLGEGSINGKFIFEKSSDTFIFSTESLKLKSIIYKKQSVNFLDSFNFNNIIIDLMDLIKQDYYNPDEISELDKVVKATASGPKSTYMDGQTQFLKVLNTHFERN